MAFAVGMLSFEVSSSDLFDKSVITVKSFICDGDSWPLFSYMYIFFKLVYFKLLLEMIIGMFRVSFWPCYCCFILNLLNMLPFDLIE